MELIIFESILTTFKSNVILRGCWVNWFEPESEPPEADLAGPIP